MKFNDIPCPSAKNSSCQRSAAQNLLLLFGDPHGDFKPVMRAVLQHKPTAIVLLGDLTPERPLHVELAEILHLTEVWWIHGNHDTDQPEFLDNISDTTLAGTPLAGRNLHGRVVRIAGLQVAGLGGIFRGSIWYPQDNPEAEPVWKSPADLTRHLKRHERWRGGIALRHRSSIFPSEVEALASRRVDLLVTHEAPSFHDHGFAAIDDLANRMQARWLVHGHHHEDINYMVSHRLRMPTGCPLRAYGVNKGSFIALRCNNEIEQVLEHHHHHHPRPPGATA
jgi:predicted phosphodiesterase